MSDYPGSQNDSSNEVSYWPLFAFVVAAILIGIFA